MVDDGRRYQIWAGEISEPLKGFQQCDEPEDRTGAFRRRVCETDLLGHRSVDFCKLLGCRSALEPWVGGAFHGCQTGLPPLLRLCFDHWRLLAGGLFHPSRPLLAVGRGLTAPRFPGSPLSHTSWVEGSE